MLLLALAPGLQAPTGLPAWAFTYELPSAPPLGPGAFGSAGGGGAVPSGPVAKPSTPATPAKAPAAPTPPVRLGDLIPEFKGPSLALGDRLDEAFVARATRRLDDFGNVLFTADEGTVEVTGASGGTRTSYLLDDRNRIQFGTSYGYVPIADSQARFEAARVLIESRFGKPVSGSRKGTETLTLDWVSPDGTVRLDLDSNGANQLWVRTTLARNGGPDRYFAPRPRDDGNGGG